jgi:hypothetical protein
MQSAETAHTRAVDVVESTAVSEYTTAAEFEARRKREFDATMAAEKARYGDITTPDPTTSMTSEERTALYDKFGIGRLPSAEAEARFRSDLEKDRGVLPPETEAARKSRLRKRDDLERAERDLRESKRRKTALDAEVKEADTSRRRREEEVKKGQRSVSDAQQKAREDKQKDAIRVWKSSSVLDTGSRSVPSAIDSSSELSTIEKKRRSLWKRATTTIGGGSLTATDKDFGKWLKDQGTKNVLNKAKSAYQDVIGSTQPTTDRGKSLKSTAASRIVDIEGQLRKINVGTTQASRLSHRGRSRSPRPIRKAASRSRSREYATTGKKGRKRPPRVGGGLAKKRKIVKVNKEPPSVSRYFF